MALTLIVVWFLLGETHRGQQWTPALTLPQVRYGLSWLLMEVFLTLGVSYLCRQVQRQLRHCPGRGGPGAGLDGQRRGRCPAPSGHIAPVCARRAIGAVDFIHIATASGGTGDPVDAADTSASHGIARTPGGGAARFCCHEAAGERRRDTVRTHAWDVSL